MAHNRPNYGKGTNEQCLYEGENYKERAEGQIEGERINEGGQEISGSYSTKSDDAGIAVTGRESLPVLDHKDVTVAYNASQNTVVSIPVNTEPPNNDKNGKVSFRPVAMELTS